MILDVSYAQGNIDWEAVMGAPGLEGVWIRASHGSRVDTHFVSNAAGAHTFKKPGQFIGYYHFAEYGAGEKVFVPAVSSGGWIKPDRVCIDVEGKIPPDVENWILLQLPHADALSAEACWLYSYEAEASHLVKTFPLRNWWIARVGDGQGHPGSTPPSYPHYALWQYSWVGRWPGINANVDESKTGPGYPGASIPQPTPHGGSIVADKVLSDDRVHSSWVLKDSGAVDTLRGHSFYGSWLSLPEKTRQQADVKSFVDFTSRDDGKPGYTLWVLTNSGAVHPYDLPLA